MVKTKTAAAFNEALAHVVDFYNLHGHVVKKIRFDAGSTENAEETVTFLQANRIQVDPCAVKAQYQNPVEREVQTLSKGIAALLIDQSALGSSFWCYAAESWVHTANHTFGSHDGQGQSPLEIVTGRVPDISKDFLFPCGCPVTSHKTEERTHHYDTKAEFGIAVGSSAGSNRATLVYIPLKGTRSWERHDVRALKMLHKGAATELEKEKIAPIIGGDWSSVHFQSAAPKTGDLSVLPTDFHRPGTLGLADYEISPRASRPKQVIAHSLDEEELAAPAEAVPPSRRTTRSTSVNILPPPTAADVVAEYHAMYAAA
jgi:hypothetical protein